MANAGLLHDSGMQLLERAREITSGAGENEKSVANIGELLRQASDARAFKELLALRPGAKRTTVDVIAEHEDGSILSLYAMRDWRSPPHNDIHWHNYWQVILVIDGLWPDTVWKPVDMTSRNLKVDREEVIPPGELQVLGPNEPHGWVADKERRTDKATLLMWSASAAGKPRTIIDPDTGQLTGEFGFLNPEPRADTATKSASAFSWMRI